MLPNRIFFSSGLHSATNFQLSIHANIQKVGDILSPCSSLVDSQLLLLVKVLLFHGSRPSYLIVSPIRSSKRSHPLKSAVWEDLGKEPFLLWSLLLRASSSWISQDLAEFLQGLKNMAVSLSLENQLYGRACLMVMLICCYVI